MNIVDQDLADAIAKSFCTALALLGDPARAEALVIEAVAALNRVTGKALRDIVVQRLVQAQLQSVQ